MKRKLGAVLLVVALALALAVPAAAHTEGDPFTTDLLAGQDIPVGTVSVWNDGGNLYVKYETNEDWVITETHVDVAIDSSDIPQTKTGNPKVGHFAYSDPHGPVPEYTYQIALSSLSGDSLCIAAHANVLKIIDGLVEQEETAWADGDPFPGKNWATYFTYEIQDGNAG